MKTAKRYHFMIDIDIPSGHAYRKHPFALNNWVKKFKPYFKNMEFLPKPESGYYRRIRYTRYIRNHRSSYDHDNLVGGFKPIQDWLVKKGLIEGDRANQIKTDHREKTLERSKDFPHIEVELYEN